MDTHFFKLSANYQIRQHSKIPINSVNLLLKHHFSALNKTEQIRKAKSSPKKFPKKPWVMILLKPTRQNSKSCASNLLCDHGDFTCHRVSLAFYGSVLSCTFIFLVIFRNCRKIVEKFLWKNCKAIMGEHCFGCLCLVFTRSPCEFL